MASGAVGRLFLAVLTETHEAPRRRRMAGDYDGMKVGKVSIEE